MATEVNQFPNLYQLLGIDPLETDQGKIESVLKRWIVQLRKLQASNPQQARRIGKIIELAKRNLLNSELKAKYDLQWQQTFGSPLSNGESAWDASELAPLLPEGDPKLAFDLASFLEAAATLPPTPHADDFQKLRRLLSDDLSSASTPVSLAAVVPSTPATRVSRPAKSLAKGLRAKRDHSLLMIIGGVLLSLGVVLSVIFVVMNTNDDPAPASVANAAPGQPNKLGVPKSGRETQGSGLPKVQGLGVTPTPGEPDKPTPADSSGNAEQPFDMQLTMQAIEDLQSEPDEMNEASAPSMEAQASAAPAADNLPPASPMSDEDKQIWREQMLHIRELLGQQDFRSATEQLRKATELARTEVQNAQLNRLKVIATLAEEFHSALVAAVGSLGAGEMFKVKSTEVAFVEGTDERIVIRLRGRNESYTLNDLPVGLAYGLAELKLDGTHPSTLARKAAFCLVHPKSNQLVLAQAKELMSEAIGRQVVAEDILEAFADNFEL